jgi:F-type H+-transporting ATPase subunit epsilon
MRLHICILTPDRVSYTESVEELILTTTTGQLGVLTGHSPLMTIIDISPIIFRRKSGWVSVALIGGLAFIKKDQIIILVDSVESACSIDRYKVQASLELATARLGQAQSAMDKIASADTFKRERARYKVCCES